ncbi:hypothetical protein [Streptomyces lunalinharesii]|uniref:Uncharacterized protein n=1 Tax=Streptomyces lunalinharesii TaxID=333384 RepID=A0ABN3T4C4_9ACTN
MRGAAPRPARLAGRTAQEREGHHREHTHPARGRRGPSPADPRHWQADEEWTRLRSSCAKYSSDWTDCYGYPIIHAYGAVADAPALFTETTRVLALKSAMYELTDGDDLRAGAGASSRESRS